MKVLNIEGDTRRAINQFNKLDRLVERSFYKGTIYEKLDKEYPNDKFIKDKILLRGFYHSNGNIETSMKVLNWPKTKVRNYAFVIK